MNIVECDLRINESVQSNGANMNETNEQVEQEAYSE